MSDRPWMNRGISILACLLAVGLNRDASAADDNASKRMVLVELYTSQGCDMCPTAEEILGKLAERDRRIVPIAFHVDYFNNPWKDVFSDPLYSRRQMVYNEVYTKPKPEGYGLYYTPMLMIDGEQSINGRDPEAALAAIRRAMAKKPAVTIDVDLALKEDSLSGKARVTVTRNSVGVTKSPLLVCAVLREDGVVTEVPSGENAGKSLVARFPARQTRFDFIELNTSDQATRSFDFTVEPTWNKKKLRIAVFVQDKQSAIVYQAADLPWRSMSGRSTTSVGNVLTP